MNPVNNDDNDKYDFGSYQKMNNEIHKLYLIHIEY